MPLARRARVHKMGHSTFPPLLAGPVAAEHLGEASVAAMGNALRNDVVGHVAGVFFCTYNMFQKGVLILYVAPAVNSL